MPPTAVVSGAAPVWVGDRLAGPRHAGAVVHSGADALYIDSGGDVIGVVSRHATAIPCTIATRAESVGALFGDLPSVGDEVVVGSGALAVGESQVRVGRYLDFTLQPFHPARAPEMAEHLSIVENEAWPTDLTPDIMALLRDHPSQALPLALGRGSGLTPFGDDVVCGLLATLLAVEDPCAPALRQDVRTLAPGRTSALSATLLWRAGEGDVLPAFAAVVTALLHRPDAVTTRVRALRAVGHTSGAGMLLGLRLALDHINTRSCP